MGIETALSLLCGVVSEIAIDFASYCGAWMLPFVAQYLARWVPLQIGSFVGNLRVGFDLNSV